MEEITVSEGFFIMEENTDPDAPVVAWLQTILADKMNGFRLEYRVHAANILIAHITKWNSGRGMSSGVLAAEKVRDLKDVLREMILSEVGHEDKAEDSVLDAMLMAAKVVLL